ncbi:MAG: methyl-accepting chemotaxis protein, partial [Haloferacaceae archaeon]
MRKRYGAKLSLALLGLTALVVAYGALIHVRATEQLGAAGEEIRSGIAAMVLLMVISFGLLGVTIGSNTVLSLRQLTRKAERMADGDLTVEFDSPREDEFGRLYDAFATLRDSLRERIDEAESAREDAEAARQKAEETRDEAETYARAVEAKATEYEDAMRAVADGDLTRRVDPDSQSEAMEDVGRAFNEMVAALAETVRDVDDVAGEVAAAADEVDARADRLHESTTAVEEAADEIACGARTQRTDL